MRAFLSSEDWILVKRLAEEMIASLQTESTLKETDYDTIKETAFKEGQLQGVRDLIKKIFYSVSDND